MQKKINIWEVCGGFVLVWFFLLVWDFLVAFFFTSHKTRMIQRNYSEVNSEVKFAESNFCSHDSQMAWRVISIDHNTLTEGKSCSWNLRITQIDLLSSSDTEVMMLPEGRCTEQKSQQQHMASLSNGPAVFPQSLRLDHQSHYFVLIFTASINVICQIWSHQMQGLQPRTQTCNESAKILILAIFLGLTLTRVCFSF